MVAVARVIILRDESGPNIYFNALHVSEGPFSHSITLYFKELLRPLLLRYSLVRVIHGGLPKEEEQISSKQLNSPHSMTAR